jgi:hypothetical protein
MIQTLLYLFLLTLPNFSFADGLVPCGGPDEPACQACYVVVLVDGVVQWLIGILATIAAIMIVYAGIKLVTSGGNVSAKTSALSMFNNVIIGFVIVMAGWLLIDTIMKAMVNDQVYGMWNKIQCVSQPEPDFVSLGLVNGGTIGVSCDSLPNGGYNCNKQMSDCTAGGGTGTIDESQTPWKVQCTYAASTYSGSCDSLSSGPCSVANLTPIFQSRAEDASQICNKESGGAPIMSGSDICCGPNTGCSALPGEPCPACDGKPSFSGGYFQINILANSEFIPGCNPSSFYTNNGGSRAEGNCVRRNARGICTGWSCTITTGTAYNSCIQGSLDPELNLSIAGQLYNGRGGTFGDWANSRNLCGISN